MKYLLLIIFLSINLSKLLSQDKLKVLNFDFSTKTFTNLDSIDEIEDGNFYQIIIDSINSNIYSISINTSDTILESKLTFPTFESFNISSLQDLLKSTTSTKESLSSVNIFVERSISEDTFLRDKGNHILEIKERIDKVMFEIKKIILSTKREFQTYTIHYNYIVKMDTLSQLRLETDKVLKDITNASNSYNKFLEDNKPALDISDTKTKEIVKTTLANFSTVLKSVSSMAESVNAKNSYDMLLSVVAAENNKNFKYTSMPFRMNGDQTSLEINIVPRDSNKLNLQSYKTKIKFPSSISRAITYGINTTFYISGLQDQSFTITESDKIITEDSMGITLPRDTVKNYKVSQNNSSTNEIGMQALVSVGIRMWSDILKGLVFFGPGININNTVRPRISAGVGIALGKRNIITLNIGWIGGNVDVKNSAIVLDGEGYSIKPGELTNSKFSSSWFFSMGYFFNP